MHMQGIQKEREAKLIQRLLALIAPYVNGDSAGFVAWARGERNRLKEAGKKWLINVIPQIDTLWC